MEYQKLRVLVADDMQSIRMLTRSVLLHLGVRQITECPNGHVAWQRLRQERFDLIICDWDMPEMDGLTLLENIRQSEDEALQKLPFLMLTGNASTQIVRRSIEIGVNDFVVKPFQPKALGDKIVALIDQRVRQPVS